MKITLNKTSINHLLFIICVVVPFFNNYELSFLVWMTTIFLSLRTNYSVEFVKYIGIFIVLLAMAAVVSLFHQHAGYFVIRDITYLLKPITGLLVGYQLFSKNIKNPFQFLLYAGVSIALYHLFLVGYGILIEGARNVREIREHAGYFNDFEIYALVILIFRKQLQLDLSQKTYVLLLTILALSGFFYLARTNFIQFIILVIALKGFFVLNMRSIKVVGTTIIVVLIGYAAIYNYNPRRNGKGMDEFLYKIKMIPEEAFSTRIDRHDWKQFNDNYRSYENIRTIQQLSHHNTLLFGEGLGSKVDLKQKIYLGDMDLRYISFLHNGFMTVILKTGLIGLLIYLTSISFFIKRSKATGQLKNIHYFFIGTGVFLIVSNWVFTGFYNLIDTKSLLIGFLFAYKNELIKQSKE